MASDEDHRDDAPRNARQLARDDRREAGERSSKLAAALMKLPDPALAKLVLDDEVREAVGRARRVTAHGARRRAERTLAGELRRFELAEVEAALDDLRGAKQAGARQLHLVEQWRARLIDGGIAAAESLPGGADDELTRLVEAAQRERATGLPRGAARALFRYLARRLSRPDPTPA